MYTEDIMDKVQQASELLEENVKLNSKETAQEVQDLGKALGTLTSIAAYVGLVCSDTVLKDLSLTREQVEEDILFTKAAVANLVSDYENNIRKQIGVDILEAMLRRTDKPTN